VFIRNDKFECISKVLCYYFIEEKQYFIFVENRESSGTIVGAEDDSVIIDSDVSNFVEVKNNFGKILFIDR
jgi:hypothetical protein